MEKGAERSPETCPMERTQQIDPERQQLKEFLHSNRSLPKVVGAFHTVVFTLRCCLYLRGFWRSLAWLVMPSLITLCVLLNVCGDLKSICFMFFDASGVSYSDIYSQIAFCF